MPRLTIVGEAWGRTESLIQHPFVGASGYELIRMLADAEIILLTEDDKNELRLRWNLLQMDEPRAAQCVAKVWYNHQDEIRLMNVFNFQPEGNNIDTLCTDKAGNHCGLPAIKAGKYIRKEFQPELDRLFNDLATEAPNCTLVAGNTAAWALLHNPGISRIRGTVALSANGRYKVLPTYHPAAVLRDWSLRPVTVLDLMKAKRENGFREIRRPKRLVFIEPSLADLDSFFDEYLVNAKALSFDVETAGNQITCIGFAPTADVCLVVPFTDSRKPNGSYWSSAEEEAKAWAWVRKVLALPMPKIGQNGLYDMHFLWRGYGIPVVNYDEDTMLMHHALHPESQKGLGFLGSVYTSEPAWKMMRVRGKTTIKRDE